MVEGTCASDLVLLKHKKDKTISIKTKNLFFISSFSLLWL